MNLICLKGFSLRSLKINETIFTSESFFVFTLKIKNTTKKVKQKQVKKAEKEKL